MFISFWVIHTSYISNSQTQHMHIKIHDHYVFLSSHSVKIYLGPFLQYTYILNSTITTLPHFLSPPEFTRSFPSKHIFYPVFAPTEIYLEPFLWQFWIKKYHAINDMHLYSYTPVCINKTTYTIIVYICMHIHYHKHIHIHTDMTYTIKFIRFYFLVRYRSFKKFI